MYCLKIAGWVVNTIFTWKYLDRHACANSVDSDQMLQNGVSDQDLHRLPLIQQFLDSTSSQMALLKF